MVVIDVVMEVAVVDVMLVVMADAKVEVVQKMRIVVW